MDTNAIIGIVIGALVVALSAWVILGSHKKQWYKVYLANNDVMLLCRDMNERWWRTSDRYMRFKNEMGVEVTFPSNAHWILMWEAVPDSQVEKVRTDIYRMKQNLAKGEN